MPTIYEWTPRTNTARVGEEFDVLHTSVDGINTTLTTVVHTDLRNDILATDTGTSYLTIRSVDDQAGLFLDTNDDGLANGNLIHATRARGTFDSKSALASGDLICRLVSSGYYDANNSYEATRLDSITNEAWDSNNRGTDMLVSVTPNGGTNRVSVFKFGGSTNESNVPLYAKNDDKHLTLHQSAGGTTGFQVIIPWYGLEDAMNNRLTGLTTVPESWLGRDVKLEVGYYTDGASQGDFRVTFAILGKGEDDPGGMAGSTSSTQTITDELTADRLHIHTAGFTYTTPSDAKLYTVSIQRFGSDSLDTSTNTMRVVYARLILQ